MVRAVVALACAFAMSATGALVAPNPAAAQGENHPEVIAPGPPPVVPYEDLSPSPGAQYVWVPGHWQYAYNRWIWVRGQWEIAPYPGAVWVSGHWARRAYGWVWVPGYWRGATANPAYGPGYPAGGIIVATPPPPPSEVIVAAPYPGAIWIGGFWRWNGGGWAWVPGHWARAPWRGAVWVPGYWNHSRGGWIWVGGFWR